MQVDRQRVTIIYIFIHIYTYIGRYYGTFGCFRSATLLLLLLVLVLGLNPEYECQTKAVHQLVAEWRDDERDVRHAGPTVSSDRIVLFLYFWCVLSLSLPQSLVVSVFVLVVRNQMKTQRDCSKCRYRYDNTIERPQSTTIKQVSFDIYIYTFFTDATLYAQNSFYILSFSHSLYEYYRVFRPCVLEQLP